MFRKTQKPAVNDVVVVPWAYKAIEGTILGGRHGKYAVRFHGTQGVGIYRNKDSIITQINGVYTEYRWLS